MDTAAGSTMNIDRVPIMSLTQDPANKRIHTDENYQALKESLRRFGQQIPIVVDIDKRIVKGNGTWQAAVELGWSEIYIYTTHLTGKEAELFALADNRIAELSEWDYEQLSLAIQKNPDMSDELLKLGWTDQVLAPLRIAKWTPAEVEKLELPPSDPHLEPCIFLDFDTNDMADIALGVARWREMHPSAQQKPDTWCVAKLCAWYAMLPREKA